MLTSAGKETNPLPVKAPYLPSTGRTTSVSCTHKMWNNDYKLSTQSKELHLSVCIGPILHSTSQSRVGKCLVHQPTYWQNGSNFFSFKDEGIESEEEVSRSWCGAQRAHDVGFAGTLARRGRLITHWAGGAADVAVTGATAITEVKASRL